MGDEGYNNGVVGGCKDWAKCQSALEKVAKRAGITYYSDRKESPRPPEQWDDNGRDYMRYERLVFDLCPYEPTRVGGELFIRKLIEMLKKKKKVHARHAARLNFSN